MVSPDFSNVLAREREKPTDVGGWGDGITDGEGLFGVRDTTDGGIFVTLPGTNVVVHRQQLFGSETEPREGAGEMGTAGEDLGKGGSG